MKNDMKLIMESWRSTMAEGEEHSNDWISRTTVVQFLDAFPAGDMVAIEDRVKKELPDEASSRVSSFFQKIKNKSVGAILNFTADQGADLVKTLAGSAAAAGVAAAGAASTGVASVLLAPWLAGKLIDISMDKAKERVNELLTSFSIPDSELGDNPGSRLVDIDDDLVKVLKGPDSTFQPDETKALMLGLKEILDTYKRVGESYDQAVNSNEDLDAWRSKTMDEFGMNSTLNSSIETAYSKLVGLQDSVNLQPQGN